MYLLLRITGWLITIESALTFIYSSVQFLCSSHVGCSRLQEANDPERHDSLCGLYCRHLQGLSPHSKNAGQVYCHPEKGHSAGLAVAPFYVFFFAAAITQAFTLSDPLFLSGIFYSFSSDFSPLLMPYRTPSDSADDQSRWGLSSGGRRLKECISQCLHPEEGKKKKKWNDLHKVKKSYMEHRCYNFIHIYFSIFRPGSWVSLWASPCPVCCQ